MGFLRLGIATTRAALPILARRRSLGSRALQVPAAWDRAKLETRKTAGFLTYPAKNVPVAYQSCRARGRGPVRQQGKANSGIEASKHHVRCRTTPW